MTSTETLIRVFVFMLYVPACLFSYWRLIPRLSPSAKRLASGMLALQILLIIAAQTSQANSAFDYWLWDFHEEWNIPATFAYLQLGTVGGVMLLTSWLARGRPIGQRLYFFGAGLLFLFLALDEYLALHEVVPNWELRYILLGAALVLVTVLVALRSSPGAQLWHFCLLLGLAISVAGAMLINALPISCERLAFLRFDGCIEFFFLEESFEFLGIWLTLVAALGHFSDFAPPPSTRARRILFALPPILIIILVLNALAPRLELRLFARPASVQFKSNTTLHGFHIDRHAEGLVLRLYVSSQQADYIGLGYSIHLVDRASGDSVASRDEWADRQHGIWLLGADYLPLYRQWMDVPIDQETAVNRAYRIVLTLWRRKEGDEYKRQKVLSSDLQLLDDRQVVLDELVLPAESLPARSPPLAIFENGFALEAVDIPDRVRVGEQLNITFAWRSDAAGLDDYSQFLHFMRAEGGEWWGYDQSPLGPRLPTRLWYAGLADSETWHIPVPSDLAPGRYDVFTGLYRASDLERLPPTDAEGALFPDARVPLGSLTVVDEVDV
ncbi:MAG: hypothetical protein OXG85_04105 [Chloroflexi bacterium]|nr:hypothetical protein [Chloroflexota bacterium]